MSERMSEREDEKGIVRASKHSSSSKFANTPVLLCASHRVCSTEGT